MTTTQTQTNADASKAMLRAIYQARAVMRTVELAAAAQEDGSVNYGDSNCATRWGPAIEFAASRVRSVRDMAMGAEAGAVGTAVAWYTPLTMLQALGAALWHGETVRRGSMDLDELQTAAQAVIEALEALAEECATVH